MNFDKGVHPIQCASVNFSIYLTTHATVNLHTYRKKKTSSKEHYFFIAKWWS